MKKYVIGVIVVIAAGIAVVVLALPWKQWLADEIKSSLAGQGLKQVEFTMDAVGWQETVITGIAFRHTVPVQVEKFTVNYSPFAVLQDIQATWAVEALSLSDTPLALPSLSGSGTFEKQQGETIIQGSLTGSGGAQLAFTLQYNERNPDASRVMVHKLVLPWNEGAVLMQEAVLPLSKDKEETFIIQMQKLPLGTLLAAVTEQRAQATGVVSGNLPVTVRGDGTFVITNGQLAAGSPGTITLSPDAIPGDNAQLALLKEVLGNFHYRVLDIGIASDKDRKLSLSLKLEGNNPNAYGGKPVKLNVHLTGDVLSLLTQSIMPMTNPKQLMEQNAHDQP